MMEEEQALSGSALDPREHGEQPLQAILSERGITNHQLVEASTEQLTHKMVAKAVRGRDISVRVKLKVLRALCALTKEEFTLKQLFNY